MVGTLLEGNPDFQRDYSRCDCVKGMCVTHELSGGKRTISRFEQEIREKTLSGNYSGKQPRLWERRVPHGTRLS
jgi:hypothetical protein